MKCYLIGLLSMLSVHAAMGQQAIDVHCYNILPAFKELLDRHGAALEETFPLPDWDVASHLKFMEEASIETSVLSMPAPQPWFGDAEESRRAVRQYNEACARLKADYPGKFLFCASLPLPDVDAAIKEAVYALDTLGADGIKLATNSRGTVRRRCGTRYVDASTERAPCRRDAASAQTFARKRRNHRDGTAGRLRISGRDDPYRRQSDCPECSGPVSESEVRRTALRFISAAGPSAHEGGISGHGGERAYGTD